MAIEMTAILAGTIAAATPLIFAGLGELVSQRTGVINLGVEGMMLVGAIAGFAFAAQYEASVFSALLIGGLAGMLMALIFAFFTLSLSTNQSACGLALTIFGLGISAFLGQNYVSMALPGLSSWNIPVLADIPFIGPILFQQNYVVYLSILAFFAVWFVLAKTRLGLLLKAVGESPESAHAMGYHVLAIRYGAVLFGGLMAGIGEHSYPLYIPQCGLKIWSQVGAGLQLLWWSLLSGNHPD
ncbi:ABC transporter permease [Acinetobacter schindleri]|uniref:ABC transporter permease n=1 Tax=Acinetobacter schindleri TaxID=108981 RepID=UPI001D18EE78|nr:ABC transporter permease [Acinetobacter schindleri]